jgi:hypothetical protein
MGQGQWGKDSKVRFVKYSAGDVARQDSGARHRNWLGGWDRCRAGFSTGDTYYDRIGLLAATARLYTLPPSPAALRLPDAGLLRKPPAGSPTGSRLKPL